MSTPYMRRRSCWKPLLLTIAAILALSSLGVAAYLWYAVPEKPSRSPEWVFGGEWLVAHSVMAVACCIWAACLIWRYSNWRKKQQVQQARKLFLLQLVLSLTWVLVFFGLENPLYGLVWLGAVWLAVAVTIVSFWRIRALAGLLLMPYLALVSSAVILNYHFVLLN